MAPAPKELPSLPGRARRVAGGHSGPGGAGGGAARGLLAAPRGPLTPRLGPVRPCTAPRQLSPSASFPAASAPADLCPLQQKRLRGRQAFVSRSRLSEAPRIVPVTSEPSASRGPEQAGVPGTHGRMGKLDLRRLYSLRRGTDRGEPW